MNKQYYWIYVKKPKKGGSSKPLFQDLVLKYQVKQKNILSNEIDQLFSLITSLKRGLELGIVFEQLIKMAKLHIMVVNSMLLAPQWHGLDFRNWQFLKFLKRPNVAEFQRLSV